MNRSILSTRLIGPALVLAILVTMLPVTSQIPTVAAAPAQTGTVSTNVDSSFQTSVTFSHITPTGDNRLLVVTVGIHGDMSVSSVTYDGNSLSLAIAHGSGTTGGQRAEIWYLVAPPIGTADVVVSFTDGLNQSGVAAISYDGINQSSPIGATTGATGISANPTVSVNTSFADTLIVGGVSARGGDTAPFTPGSGTTDLYDMASGPNKVKDDGYTGGEESTPTTGAYTFDFTAAVSEDWAIAVAELRSLSTPTVTTQAATSVNTTGATLNGNITDVGSSNATKRGFQYGLTTAYGDNFTETGNYGTGSFSTVIGSLDPGTTYHYRAIALNTEGWAFGGDQSFVTTTTTPTVVTVAADGISPSGATLNGNVSATGGASIDERGFDYGLTTGYGSEATEAGSFGTGTFNEAITGLSPSTLYHFRAKAHNSQGWSYGSDDTFTTNSAGAATVVTNAATSVNSSGATINGNITSTGGENADIRGFDYGATESYGSNTTESGSFGTGTFSAVLGSLTPGVTYHFRAKVHNSSGWAYGSDTTFTTDVILSTVSTSAATSVAASEATLNGNITATGGENADIRGFQYGLTAGYGTNATESGSYGTGTFGLEVSSLSSNTTYHFRAMAHNSAGWSYGADQTLGTDPLLAPTVTTSAASGVSVYGATLNGNIAATGGENADIRGFQYGLTTGYGTNSTESGSYATGTFDAEPSGLDADTTYHFRAMAHNSQGWNYGTDQTFTTNVPGVAPVYTARTLNSSSGSRSSANFTHNTPAGDNRLLVVILGIRGDVSASSVIYNSQSLTLAKAHGSGTATGQRVEIWYLVNPPDGSYNVVVNYASPADADGIAVMSYDEVDQNTPIGDTSGADSETGTNPTVQVAVGSDDALIVGGISLRGGDNGPFTPGSGTTERYDFASGSHAISDDVYAGGDEDAATSDTYTFDFTGTGSDDWAIAAIELRPISGASVTTQAATSVNSTGATLNANITDIGSSDVTIRDFEYGLTTAYGSNTTQSGSYGTGTYNLVVSGLEPGTTYHFRAGVYNTEGWAYGSDLTFATNAAAPTVTTAAAGGLGPNGATLNGEVTATGGASIDIRGFDYGLTAGYGTSATESGSFGAATFQQTLTGLAPSTLYHFRAKAHNGAGWGYGSDLTFTTNAAGAASVTTQAATEVNSANTTLNANVTNTGGINLDARGFDYGLTDSYGSSVTANGSFGTGTYSEVIASLSPGSEYHYRAKVHNTAGWSYGTDLHFHTDVVLPTVATQAATSIEATLATLNGSVTDTGGENVDIRGFDYGLTVGYGSSWTENGSFNTGDYNVGLSSLTPDTTYHFRAKTHNTAGWSYGDDLTFTTDPLVAPTVTTSAASSVSVYGATLNGNISDVGGENADIRGFQYGLTTGYGTNATASGSFGTGTFYEELTGLNSGTTYHFRAMAHNSVGWSYGSDLTFTTGVPGVSPVFAGRTIDASNNDHTSTVFSHNTPAGNNRALLVIVGIRGDESVTSLSYGGISLTKELHNSSGTIDGQRVEIWYLANPPLGSNNVVVNFATSVNPSGITAMSYNGVNQLDPIGGSAGTNNTSGTSLSVDINAYSDDALIVGGVSTRGGDTDPFTPGSGTTERYDFESGGNNGSLDDAYAGGDEDAATAGVYTFDFTSSLSDDWAIAAVELRPVSKPSVATQAATSVNSTGATLNGNITDLGSSNVTSRGFQYGLTAGYGSNTTESGNFSTGTYSLVLSSLNPGTTYHFRAIAFSSEGWAYGEDADFTTDVDPPTVTSSAASGLGPNSATMNGEVTDIGGASVDIRGFDYGLTESHGSTATESGTFGTGTFQQTLGGLSANTTYHFRAKAHNSSGWGYGANLTFTTNPAGAATIITQAATSVNSTGATLNGNLTNTGGINADIRGFEYGTTTGYGTNATESGSFGAGTFNATISGLNPGVTYHFRAMSHNTAGWSYGTDLTFTPPVDLPSVLSAAASSVSQLQATLNGSIIDTGGENIDIRGFQYGLTAGYGSNTTESGDYGVSSFNLVVSDLAPSTLYHFRTQAHNSAGWAYGSDLTFTTSALSVPAVTTAAASSVGVLSATLNGEITDIGGASADARGFDYGLTTGYGSSVTSNGTFGVEAFYEMASGLSANTTYHFRAKAHNSQGWGYGGDLTFTTGIPGAEPIHTATTTDSSNLDRSSANFSHSTPTGTDLALLVICNIRGDEFVSSITYGGADLTIAVAQGSGQSSGQRVEIWYLINPSTGANDVVVSYNGTANPDSVIALSYENVNQTSPIGTTAGQNFNSGTNPSLNISTTVVDALIVGGTAVRGGDADPFTPGSGVTERYDFATGTSALDDDSFTGGEKSAAAISSYTFDFTSSNSNYWAIAAVELKPPTPPANISNSPGAFAFGIVQMSDTPSTGLTQFTLNNSSVYAINVSVSAGDMVGDSNWILSDTATPGADTFGLKAGLEGGSYNVIIKKTVPYNVMVSNMAVSSTQKWGLQLVSPTSTSDGSMKSTSVVLTVTVA